MPDLADLRRINLLYEERAIVAQALSNITDGGRIVQMVIAPPEDAPLPGPGVRMPTVNTHSWTYPQPMVDAISSQLQSRLNEINAELAGMGVTGI